MQVVKVPTANGIDDIKIIGENETERLFIKQLAEAGTLSCMSYEVSDSVLFRAISASSDSSFYESTINTIAKYNFSIRQNQNFNNDLIFNTDSGPLDLRQYPAIKMQIKHSKSAPAIVELSIGNGLEIIGEDYNTLAISMTADQTKILTYENYYYDILTATPTSNLYPIEGKITIKNTATR
jgi:hypothetical protein